MLNRLEYSNFTTSQGLAKTLRKTGWILFWLQLGLGVVSAAILTFAIADPNFNLKTTNPMSGAGLFFAVGGLFLLAIGLYSAFSYVRLANESKELGGIGHQKSEVIKVFWRGLFINAVGSILTLLGIEFVVGTLIAKSLTQVEGMAIYNSTQLIEPLDLLVVQANVNTIVAQSIGILFAAWSIGRIGRHQPHEKDSKTKK